MTTKNWRNEDDRDLANALRDICRVGTWKGNPAQADLFNEVARRLETWPQAMPASLEMRLRDVIESHDAAMAAELESVKRECDAQRRRADAFAVEIDRQDAVCDRLTAERDELRVALKGARAEAAECEAAKATISQMRSERMAVDALNAELTRRAIAAEKAVGDGPLTQAANRRLAEEEAELRVRTLRASRDEAHAARKHAEELLADNVAQLESWKKAHANACIISDERQVAIDKLKADLEEMTREFQAMTEAACKYQADRNADNKRATQAELRISHAIAVLKGPTSDPTLLHCTCRQSVYCEVHDR
jgi:hypothetical protein